MLKKSLKMEKQNAREPRLDHVVVEIPKRDEIPVDK